MSLSKTLDWVVPENICTPTTGGILEFRMYGEVLWPGIPNARGWGGGVVVLGLEFRMHEGVSSSGIPKGRGAKNSDLLTSEVQKTSLVCALAEQTEPQRYDYEVGMRSLFIIAIKCLLSTVVF